LDIEGLAYAGGAWDDSKYTAFIPDADNVLPITDEAYLDDDIVERFAEFVKVAYGEETLEENLNFVAQALESKGDSSREIIRNYFLKEFFKDHCKTYKKRPIYWLFDSGKTNAFKALVYLHRYDEDNIGRLRVDYLHKLQRRYDNEIVRMQEVIEHSNNNREISQAEKRREKLKKQVKECNEYDEKIAHLALARIPLDLDDGVKVNYEKIQTDRDGNKLDVLAKI
jgi:type II restriction/modification system DNA methylase subunit YeeA